MYNNIQECIVMSNCTNVQNVTNTLNSQCRRNATLASEHFVYCCNKTTTCGNKHSVRYCTTSFLCLSVVLTLHVVTRSRLYSQALKLHKCTLHGNNYCNYVTLNLLYLLKDIMYYGTKSSLIWWRTIVNNTVKYWDRNFIDIHLLITSGMKQQTAGKLKKLFVVTIELLWHKKHHRYWIRIINH